MRTAQMTREDEIRSVSQKYEMDKEKVRDILERGVRYADVDKAALFACMTGKDIEEVLALRREEPWGRVQVRLGITGDRYDEKYFSHRARRLHRFYGVEETRAFNALKEGYPNHWIRLAYLLEVKTGKKMEEILAVKKKTPKWKEWAEINLGVKPEDFSQWIMETRNPALKPK